MSIFDDILSWLSGGGGSSVDKNGFGGSDGSGEGGSSVDKNDFGGSDGTSFENPDLRDVDPFIQDSDRKFNQYVFGQDEAPTIEQVTSPTFTPPKPNGVGPVKRSFNFEPSDDVKQAISSIQEPKEQFSWDKYFADNDRPSGYEGEPDNTERARTNVGRYRDVDRNGVINSWEAVDNGFNNITEDDISESEHMEEGIHGTLNLGGNRNNPYITVEELGRQIDAGAAGDRENEARGWLQSLNANPKDIVSKAEAQRHGYTPYSAGLSDDIALRASGIADSIESISNDIATFRETNPVTGDWEVTLPDGAKVSGRELDKVLEDYVADMELHAHYTYPALGNISHNEISWESSKIVINKSGNIELRMMSAANPAVQVGYVELDPEESAPIVSMYRNGQEEEAGNLADQLIGKTLNENMSVTYDPIVIDGHEIPFDESIADLTKNKEVLMGMQGAGLLQGEADIESLQQNAGNAADYGFLNMSMPSYAYGGLWDNISGGPERWTRLAPQMTDIALSSAPYFFAPTLVAKGAADTVSALSGANPHAYRDGVYKADSYLQDVESAPYLAALATAAERLAGAVGGGGAGKGYLDRALEFLPKKIREARLGPGKGALNTGERIAVGATGEGVEEDITAPLWDMFEHGVNGAYDNKILDENGNFTGEYDDDTSFDDKVGNYFDEFLDNYFGGFLLGLPIAASEEAVNHLNANKSGKSSSGIDYSSLSKHIIDEYM